MQWLGVLYGQSIVNYLTTVGLNVNLLEALMIKSLTAICAFFLVWIGLWTLIAIPLFRRLGWRPFRAISTNQKLQLLLPLYLLAPGVIAGANAFLGQTWQAQGVVVHLREMRAFGVGWGIAIAGLIGVLVVKKSAGLTAWQELSLPGSWREIRQTLLLLVGVVVLGMGIGSIEELIFRGWLETQLELIFNPWVAALAGSFIFAIAHLVWDGRSGLWQQPGLWILGIVLVIARWADGGSLALACGLHSGWVGGLAAIGAWFAPYPIETQPSWLAGQAERPLTDVIDVGLLGLTGLLLVCFLGN